MTRKSMSAGALPVFLLLAAFPLYGAGPDSATELGIGFHPEYTRSFHYAWDFFVFGRLQLPGNFTAGGGVAAGKIRDIVDVDAYAFAEYAVPFWEKYFPARIQFRYIYNGLPAYKTHVHTLLPLFSVNWRRFGFSLGETLRFTRFDGAPVSFEPILSYALYGILYTGPGAHIRLGIANGDDFTANNIGSWFVALRSRFAIGPAVFVISEVKVDISGNVRDLTSVYGISVREGIVFSW